MRGWRKGRSRQTDLSVPLVDRRTTKNPLVEAMSSAPSGKDLHGSFTDDETMTYRDKRPTLPTEAVTLEQRFTQWCQHMGFSDDLLAEYQVDKDELKKLYHRDTASSWLSIRAHWLYPRSMAYMPERLWLALTMRPAWVSPSLARRLCWDPRDWIWIRGITIPMVNPKGYALKLLMSHLWRGGVNGFKLTLHAVLLISLGIQVQKVLDEHPEDIWHTLRDGDAQTWKQLIYSATGNAAGYFWPVIFAPMLWMALSRMILMTTRTLARGQGQLVQTTTLLMKRLEQPSLWSSWIRPCLPFDQPSFQLTTVVDQLAFDGRVTLSPQYRQHTIHYLITAIQHTRGLHRWLSVKALAQLTLGTHIQNLAHYTQKHSAFTPATPLSHLVIRIAAMKELERLIHTQPSCKQAWIYREWAQHQGWMSGRRTDVLRVMTYLIIHTLGLAYFIYGFKVIVNAIQAYLDCPDKTGVSMTGIAAWSSDYTQPCFDAYLHFFRKIPGQPLSFLLDIIARVHFTNKQLALDLSYKSLNGSEVARIIEGLSHQGVELVSIDLTGNLLATSKDYTALMPSLIRQPHLRKLVLHDVGLETGAVKGANATGTITMAHYLPQLAYLQALSIRANALGGHSPLGVKAIAVAIAQCQQLQSFRLFGNGLISSDRAALAMLIDAVSTLHHLTTWEMSGFLMVDEVAMALARKMPLLGQLEHFLMRYSLNQASAQANTAFLNALSHLHHVHTIDLTGNMIGYIWENKTVPPDFHPAALIANATRGLDHLKALKLTDTFLGYRGTGGGLELAHALDRRAQPLQVLELNDNIFSADAFEALNQLLERWKLPTMPIQMRTPNETLAFLAGLPINQSHVELDDGPQNDASLSMLFSGVSNTSINKLYINGLRFHPHARGFRGLSQCRQLRRLRIHFNVLNNVLSMDTDAWLSLFHELSWLRELQELSIYGGDMFLFPTVNVTAVTTAVVNTLHLMPQLQSLNLVSNVLGEHSEALPIFEAIGRLSALKNLNLGINMIGCSSGQASHLLLSRLPLLHHLESLNIYGNCIGEHRTSVRLLTRFLTNVSRPFFLNASFANLGQHQDVAQELMIAIADNPHVSANLRDSGFGTALWPPQVARLASETYDPYLQAACSNLQCFGVQPTLPSLGNSTRINFKQQTARHAALSTDATAITMLATLGLILAFCLGVGFLITRTRRMSKSTNALSPSPCKPAADPCSSHTFMPTVSPAPSASETTTPAHPPINLAS